MWADESGLVTNLAVTGSGNNAFVQFEVPAANIKNGNAVIAVTRGGTVVWSWHLWFAPQDVLGTVTCTNFQGYEYKFTNETLGWKYTAWSGTTYSAPRSVKVKVRQTKGQISPATRTEAVLTITQNPGNVRQGSTTLYQFGRKDAMPGVQTVSDGSFTPNGGNNMSIQNGIRHPENFYNSGPSWYNNPPTGYSYYNLWSMDNTTTGYNDNAVVKTIYDPCPAGFHMPASNAFTGFTTNGQNYGPMNVRGAWNHGWNFNNKITSPDAAVYFPASGYRGYGGDGSLRFVGDYGYYWSAVRRNTNYGCHLGFSLWDVYPQGGDYRANGFSVHPVAEPKTRVTPKLPGSTEEDWSNNEDLDAGDIDI